jgi:hypothetical protein
MPFAAAIVAVVVGAIVAPTPVMTVMMGGGPGIVVESDANIIGVFRIMLSDVPAFAIAITGHIGRRRCGGDGESANSHGGYQ